MDMFSLLNQLPFTHRLQEDGESVVYGTRIDVINNGELALNASGIIIESRGVYTFQYPDNAVINDTLKINFIPDSTNPTGTKECLVVVYKPSKEVVRT
jgi:hypothetical protein